MEWSIYKENAETGKFRESPVFYARQRSDRLRGTCFTPFRESWRNSEPIDNHDYTQCFLSPI